jgi:hypothetical protein
MAGSADRFTELTQAAGSVEVATAANSLRQWRCHVARFASMTDMPAMIGDASYSLAIL